MLYFRPKTILRGLLELLGFVFCDKHHAASSFMNPYYAGCLDCWEEFWIKKINNGDAV